MIELKIKISIGEILEVGVISKMIVKKRPVSVGYKKSRIE